MFLKAVIAFLALPFMVCAVIPLIFINYDPYQFNGYKLGFLFSAIGLVILLRCVYDFYKIGKGTLAHWSPPKKIMTTGLYSYVRSPMYIGVLMILIGEGLALGSPLIFAFALFMFIAFNLHIRLVEEPWLAKSFPEEWAEYSKKVNRWVAKQPSNKQ